MSLVTGVAVYFIIWWTVLFAILPWGARPPENPEPGMADSAPVKPRIAMKFLATTIVSAVLFAALYAVIEADVISFRQMAREL